MATRAETKPRKISRLRPKEVVMVSLVGRPSAKAATFAVVARSASTVADEVLREAPPTLPEGTELRRFDVALRQVDRERRIVWGRVYNPPWNPADGAEVTDAELAAHVDQHGTYMTPEDLEAAAHRFLQVSRGVDVNHDKVPGAGVPVESFIARGDWGPWQTGDWVMATRIEDDETWRRVELGLADPTHEDALIGYSIHVLAEEEAHVVHVIQRSAPSEEPAAPPQLPELTEEQADGMFAWLKRLFTVRSAPAAVAEATREAPAAPAVREEGKAPTDFAALWNAEQAEQQLGQVWWILRRVVCNILESAEVTDKPAAISKAFSTAQALVLNSLVNMQVATREAATTDPLGVLALVAAERQVLERAGKKMSAKRLEKLKGAEAALLAACNHVAEILAEVDDSNEEDETMNAEQMRAAVADALRAELAPVKNDLAALSQRVGVVEAARAAPESDKGAGAGKGDGEPDAAAQMAATLREVVRSEVAPLREELAGLGERVKRVEGVAPASRVEERAAGGGDEKKNVWAGLLG